MIFIPKMKNGFLLLGVYNGNGNGTWLCSRFHRRIRPAVDKARTGRCKNSESKHRMTNSQIWKYILHKKFPLITLRHTAATKFHQGHNNVTIKLQHRYNKDLMAAFSRRRFHKFLDQ